MKQPYFSIITPMYNRQYFIGETIESCLNQSKTDFELIIIDDGSTDNSLSIVNSYKDSRIRILQHPENRGPCPARNTGINYSRGVWYLILDSDFLFLPGALESIYNRTIEAPMGIGNIYFRCLWDTGEISPTPSSPERVLNYIDYLKWSDNLTVSEAFNCISSVVFSNIRYPENRAWETSFHLELAYNWQLWLTQDVVVKISTKAQNRLTTSKGVWARERMLFDANDRLVDIDNIWRKYGLEIKRYAPNRYLTMLRESGRLNFLCGNRHNGIAYISKYLQLKPFHGRAWLILLFGLLGPKTLAWAITLGR